MISLAKDIQSHFYSFEVLHKNDIDGCSLPQEEYDMRVQLHEEMPFELYNRLDWDMFCKEHTRRIWMTQYIKPIVPLESLSFTVTIGGNGDITFGT